MSIKKEVMMKAEPVEFLEVSCEIEIGYDENNRKTGGPSVQPNGIAASDCEESESERHYIRFDDDDDTFYLSESESDEEESAGEEEIDSIEEGMMLIFNETHKIAADKKDVRKKKSRSKLQVEDTHEEVPLSVKEEVIDPFEEESKPNLVAGCQVSRPTPNPCAQDAFSHPASQPSGSLSGSKWHLGPNDRFATIASSDNIEPLIVVVRNVDSDKPICEPLRGPSGRKPKVEILNLKSKRKKTKPGRPASLRSMPLREAKAASLPAPVSLFPRICLKDTTPLHCVLCNIECSNRRALIDHVKSHSTDKKSFECPTCRKTFTQQCNLKRHMRCHSGERPYGCPHCKKLFADQGYLTTHLRYHTNTKPYTCEHCDKAFFDRSNYVKHLRSHSGEKPYPCLVCRKSFLQQSDLTRHSRVHSGERPFKCAECGRSFTQHGDLTTHLRRHTGERPFVCADCRKTFANKRYLNSHVRGRICLKSKKPATDSKPIEQAKPSPVLTKRLTLKKELKVQASRVELATSGG